MPVYAKSQSGGGATSDAASITSGVLDLARLPAIPASKLAADAATQAELDAAVVLRQLADSDLTTIAAMVPATGDMLMGQGGVWSKKTLDQIKALLSVSVRPAPLLTLDGALSARQTTPARIVFAGSSTTAGSNASAPAKRWVNTFMSFLQTAYPSGTGSEPSTLADINGAFGTVTPLPGVQGFNIGQGSTTASTFLTDAESQIIASLDPSVIFYMVGSNDFAQNISITTFTTNLQNRINYIKARLLNRPCAHILVGAYERWDVTGTVPWAQYGTAMQAIADASPSDTYFTDLNSRYVAFNIPGAKGTPGGAGAPGTDPNGLISSDKIHQNDTGHEQMARWIYQDVMGVTPLTPGTTPGGGTGGGSATVGPVTDNFNRTSTNTLASAVTGQTWSINTGSTWATDGAVAYMSAGTNGLATAACGYSDITFGCKVRRPISGSCGIRVRQSEGVNTGLALYYDGSNNLVVLSTVINNVISVKDSIAVPSDIAVGDYATLTISANGAEVIGYVNGVRQLSTTLSAADVTALPGTSIALRQTVSGINYGAFDDVSADTVQIVLPPGTNAITDTFTRGSSTTSLGTTDTGQAYTSATSAIWGVSAAGKGYMVNLNGATGGVATLPAAATDVDFTAEFVRPSSGSTGIRVRVTGASSGIAGYFDSATGNLWISTVESATNTNRGTALNIPTSTIAVGATMKLRLVVVGTAVSLYLNDAATPSCTYTLTGTQITGITGTDVGLRQTVAGTANGSFDNLIILNTGAPVVDTSIFPTTDIAGLWKLEWSNDFNTTFAVGQARTQLGSALCGFDGAQDTSKWGTYDNNKTVSSVAGAISGGGQGYLNIHPYYNSTDNKYYQGCLTPPAPLVNGSSWGQLSGRYSMRARIINNVKGNYTKSDGTTGQDTGVKFLDMHWPAINIGQVDPKGVTVIDPWDLGEINGPEGNTAGTPEGFAHFATGSNGSRNHGNALAFSYGAPFSEWHTYTTEWIAGVSVKYFLDGVLKATAPASGVPYVKMYRSTRTETWLDTSRKPPVEGTCDVQVDWMASYSKIG